jgi:hypothetical protein
MFRRNTRAYRLMLAFVALLVVGGLGVGYLVFRINAEALADLPNAAEESYKRGREALEAQDAAKALKNLDEAKGLTEKAGLALDEEKKKAKAVTPEKEKEWEARQGKLYWLRSQILCDQAFAAALRDGKPINPLRDAFSGGEFRSVAQIPDRDDRFEAINRLRQASGVLTKDLAVQQETLRMELLEPFWNWTNIERICRRIINLDDKNLRAHYYLARFDFEQYQEGKILNDKQEPVAAFIPTDPRKRSRDRVNAAGEHLEILRQAPDTLIWRTLALDAQINRWLATDAAASGRETRKLDNEYRNLLWNTDTGVMARASRQEGFAVLSSVDFNGLLELHNGAIDFGVDRSRQSMGGDIKQLFQSLNALADLADHLWDNPHCKDYRSELLEANIRAGNKARRFLGGEAPPEWPAYRDHLEQLAQKAVAANLNAPTAYAFFAQLLNNEAHLAGKKGDRPAKQDLQERALKWINEGLKIANAAKAQNSSLVELHGMAVEILAMQGAESNALEPHLDALRKVNHIQRAAAILGVQEAALWTRQGKLAKARATLEELSKNPRLDEFRPRVLTLLANILLSTDQPVQAVSVLNELQKSYDRVEDLNPIERAWMVEFLREPQEIAMLIAIAELDSALAKYERFFVENPGRRDFDATTKLVLESHENRAAEALKKLSFGKESHQRALAKFVTYYLQTNRIGKALDTIDVLKKGYPDNVEVLRLEVAIDLLPNKDVSPALDTFEVHRNKGDRTIKSYLRAHPTDSAAKRFWVEWLIRTERREEALTYLKDLKNFPESRDPATERMLAVALLGDGQHDEGTKLLQKLAQQLPNDRSLDLLLIMTTVNPVIRQKMLDDARKTQENSGLLRLLLAEKLIADGKLAEAARLYWDTRDFTRVTMAARMGFLRSLWLLADADPDKALAQIEQYIQESPEDGMVYVLAAYAKLKREEFGEAADSWERKKTMCGALAAWDAAAHKGGIAAPERAIFKSQFWSMANRPDQAWALLEPFAQERYERSLIQLVEVALEIGDDQKLVRALQCVRLLQEGRDVAPFHLLEARVHARMGNRAKAAYVLKELQKKLPTFLPAYPLLVQLLNERQQTDEAAKITDEWLKLAPDDPVPMMESIRQELAAGRTVKAKDTATGFLRSAEERAEAKLPKSTDPDVMKANQNILRNVRVSANLMLAQAWQFAEQYQGAEEYLAECLREAPNYIPARLLRAQNETAQKRWAKAAADYEAVLKDDKDNFIARTNLAWLFAEHLDRRPEAMKLIREELKNGYTGRPVDVKRLSPEFLDTLGVVFTATARKDDKNVFTEMLEIFDSAQRRYPNDPRLFQHLGDAYAGSNQNDEAVSAYQRALKLLDEGKGTMSADRRNDLMEKLKQSMKAIGS